LGNFSCGNKNTLFNSFEDKQLLIDIIYLFRYYHYNARNAAVVISGPIDIDIMTDLIIDKFGQLKNYEFET